MKIIKCGGSVISDINFKKQLYKDIKTNKEKIVLIVSAFNNGPYSTNTLSNLLTNNFTYEMREQLITLGEIISSIKICNEMLNEMIDVACIYKEEIGIYVKTSDKMEYIEKINSNIIKEKISKHQVLIIPGFIAYNQDNKLVSLNKNGSDLTALIVAKMLEINEVNLYKNVLGLSSIDPKINKKYKLYQTVSYALMEQITIHGSELLSLDAIRYAKENNIKINIQFYLNSHYKTTIDKFCKEKVIVFQIDNNDIYIDGYNNKEHIEKLLSVNEFNYEYVLPCNSFIKIVCNKDNSQKIFNYLYSLFLKGELQ